MFAMPAHQPRKIIFDSNREGLVLYNKKSFLNITLHVCRESRAFALEKSTILYGTQPIYTQLSNAIITLRTGTCWSLFTLSQIFGDNDCPSRRYAIFSEVLLWSLRKLSNYYYGGVANFLVPLAHVIENSNLQGSDTVLIVHRTWNEALAHDIDMTKLKDRYEDSMRHFGPQTRWGEHVAFERWPNLKHITVEEFNVIDSG